MVSKLDLQVLVVVVDAVGGSEHPAAVDEGATAEGVGAGLLESHLPGVLVPVSVAAVHNTVGQLAAQAALAVYMYSEKLGSF